MKKIIIALSVLLVAVGISGCNDFLDVVPDNRTQIDNMEKVKALLVAAYPNRIYAASLEPRCDGIMDLGATMDGTQPITSFAFAYTAFRWDEYPSLESDDDPIAYWEACYGAIAAANHALQAIEKLGNPKGSSPYKAEAQLCRAYAHFCLLTLFTNFFDEDKRAENPGIPYVTEPEEIVNKKYERGTIASTLEKIKADLAEGLANVGTAADYSQPKFHFSLSAARMLAMRIALFERDYPAVINYASQLIPQPTTFSTLSSGGKPLTNEDGTTVKVPSPTDVAFLFCGANLYNWNNAVTSLSGSTNHRLAFSNARNNNVVLMGEPYSLAWRMQQSSAYTRYTYNNKTYNAIIGSNASGVNWRLPSYGFSSAPADAPGFVPKIYEDFKTTNINANTGQPYVRIALFRLEEAILARAEAYAMTSEYDKALYDLTMYVQNRVNAGLGSYFFSRDKVVEYYTEALANPENYMRSSFNSGRFSTDVTTYEGKLQRGLVMTVLDARRTEYLHEGMRWFDILRWNIPVTHTMKSGEKSTLTPDDDRRVIQLPQTTQLAGLEKNRFDNIPNPWN